MGSSAAPEMVVLQLEMVVLPSEMVVLPDSSRNIEDNESLLQVNQSLLRVNPNRQQLLMAYLLTMYYRGVAFDRVGCIAVMINCRKATNGYHMGFH